VGISKTLKERRQCLLEYNTV